jgi:hypothetical protein
MKILRSITQRGYTVRTAGWFTVTSPNRWFAASKLPGGFRFLADRATASVAQAEAQRDALDRSSTQAPKTPQIITPGTPDHRLPRLALGAVVAAAFTYLMLWWMGRP